MVTVEQRKKGEEGEWDAKRTEEMEGERRTDGGFQAQGRTRTAARSGASHRAGDRHQITSVIDLLSSPKPPHSKLVSKAFQAGNITRHRQVNGVIASW